VVLIYRCYQERQISLDFLPFLIPLQVVAFFSKKTQQDGDEYRHSGTRNGWTSTEIRNWTQGFTKNWGKHSRLFFARRGGVPHFSIVELLANCTAEEHQFFAHSLGPLAWILLAPFFNSLSFILLVIVLVNTQLSLSCTYPSIT
jgi:hypothetical protein